jgi:hypothetical protein
MVVAWVLRVLEDTAAPVATAAVVSMAMRLLVGIERTPR